jgi:hypothetical protein
MNDDAKPPEPETDPSDSEQPPPFSPDPRLVTYLERGRRDDAPEKLRKALEKRRNATRD